MSSKKKKKLRQQPKSVVTPKPNQSKEIKLFNNSSPLAFSAVVTGIFFVVALIGMLSHEMWRDEHQAWLVARDANSLPQLLTNMKYEGNPALWQFFLFILTRFTHDPIAMQAFHLLVAVSFIFIFNRYAPFNNLHKILFSFGYFVLYEYAVISRSYGLGILILFSICALYKYRTQNYIWIGLLLALLANVTIYAIIIGLCVGGVVILDYILYQEKNKKITLQLSLGVIIFVLGLGFSLYQIWPEQDNSFPALYAKSLDFSRLWQVCSKLFTTYFYIPQVDEHFWNSNIYDKNTDVIATGNLGDWLNVHPDYFLTWIILPLAIFAAGTIIFLRKPLILLLYIGSTIGLLSIYYYTALMHSRYCGYLLISLIISYWLARYYPEKKSYGSFARFGQKISNSLLTIVLSLNVIGTIIAYAMDMQYKFSTSKEAAIYIKQNKLDSLPIVGVTDFTISPLATYLNTKIYYPQMNEYGSFTIWNNKRKDQMKFSEVVASLGAFMDKNSRRQVLWVKDIAPQISKDGINKQDVEKAILRNNLQVDLLKKTEPGIVADERYYIYLVRKVDPNSVDYSKYIRVN